MYRKKYTLTLGVVIRKTVISSIKDIAFMYDIDICIEEDSGWFSSDYRITLQHPDKDTFDKGVLVFETYLEDVERKLKD